MLHNPFTPSFDQLPRIIPVFPLDGALLMPGTQLPLNIFEPRYLNMIKDALGSDGFIGMIQSDASEQAHNTGLYRTGSAGRITSFAETDDGRYMIALSGICRFDIIEEVPTDRGYRRMLIDWGRFHTDFDQPLDDTANSPVDRDALTERLKRFADTHKAEVDWDSFQGVDDETLVNALITSLPLPPVEVQSLISTPELLHRAELLSSLMDMLQLSRGTDTEIRH